jgi:4-hydroxybenzoate polyprenyltransferase
MTPDSAPARPLPAPPPPGPAREPGDPRTTLGRWWVYQRERFPVAGHGLLIGAFSVSAVCFSMMLRGAIAWPDPRTVVVAWATAFLFFLQLRIADEFKDFEEDARYRPYRAVPRGLVSLRELGGAGAAAAVLQLGLALWLLPALAVVLAVVWVYLVLMSKEFFAPGWLKARPVVYMLSHMAIVPMIDFYATATDWLPTQGAPPAGLFWFVATSYFNGLVIEIGRKIRSPEDEEVGVNTYSALWGRRTAVAAWLGAMTATAACAVLGARAINSAGPVAAWLVLLLGAAAVVAWRFLARQRKGAGKRVEILSGLWTLGMYLSLGAAPLLWRLLARQN